MTENEILRLRLAALEREMSSLKGRSGDERAGLAAAQARADSVGAALGIRPNEPGLGESLLTYRKRVIKDFLSFSPHFQKCAVSGLDDAALSLVEGQVYHDAGVAAHASAKGQPGRLVAFQERDIAGRVITKFEGDNLAWMQHFMSGGQGVKFDPITMEYAKKAKGNYDRRTKQ